MPINSLVMQSRAPSAIPENSLEGIQGLPIVLGIYLEHRPLDRRIVPRYAVVAGHDQFLSGVTVQGCEDQTIRQRCVGDQVLGKRRVAVGNARSASILVPGHLVAVLARSDHVSDAVAVNIADLRRLDLEQGGVYARRAGPGTHVVNVAQLVQANALWVAVQVGHLAGRDHQVGQAVAGQISGSHITRPPEGGRNAMRRPTAYHVAGILELGHFPRRAELTSAVEESHGSHVQVTIVVEIGHDRLHGQNRAVGGNGNGCPSTAVTAPVAIPAVDVEIYRVSQAEGVHDVLVAVRIDIHYCNPLTVPDLVINQLVGEAPAGRWWRGVGVRVGVAVALLVGAEGVEAEHCLKITGRQRDGSTEPGVAVGVGVCVGGLPANRSMMYGSPRPKSSQAAGRPQSEANTT